MDGRPSSLTLRGRVLPGAGPGDDPGRAVDMALIPVVRYHLGRIPAPAGEEYGAQRDQPKDERYTLLVFFHRQNEIAVLFHKTQCRDGTAACRCRRVDARLGAGDTWLCDCRDTRQRRQKQGFHRKEFDLHGLSRGFLSAYGRFQSTSLNRKTILHSTAPCMVATSLYILLAPGTWHTASVHFFDI